MKDHSKVILILLGGVVGCFALLFLYGLWSFFSLYDITPSAIEEGFSDELLQALEREYGIVIPEDAEFIKGENQPHPQDPNVVVYFKCRVNKDTGSKTPDEKLMNALGLTEDERGDSKHSLRKGSENIGGELDHHFGLNKSFSFIDYSISGDELTVRIVGWRPGAEFD